MYDDVSPIFSTPPPLIISAIEVFLDLVSPILVEDTLQIGAQ